MPDTFLPDEAVLYPVTDQFNNRVIHRVTVHQLHPDGTADIITSRGAGGSLNLLRVPIDSLQKPPQANIPAEYRIPPPPPAPPRIGETSRRAKLRQAHQAAATTSQAVGQARERVDVILKTLADLERQLHKFDRLEHQQQAAIMKSVRDGKPIADTAEYDTAEKHRLANRIAQTETAAAAFRRELQDAESAHRTAQSAVATAASHVVASVIESASDELAQLEHTTMMLRSRLQAACSMWPTGSSQVPVNSAVLAFITTPPTYTIPAVAGLSERHSETTVLATPFKRLYDQLLSDPDVQFSWR